MTHYRLYKLAPGSYDVVLNGVIIASLVRTEAPGGHGATWTAELLVDPSPEERPTPFTEPEHQFATLEEARAWLGNPVFQEKSLGEAPPMITPAQCKEARAALGWNEDRLARAAGVSPITVTRFENGKSAGRPYTLDKIRAAFEAAGIEFTNGGEPGVKLRKQG